MENERPKIIFLDVDGVLSNSRCVMYTISKDSALFDKEMNYPLEIRCLKLLHKITKQSSAKIVLTST